MPFDYWRESWEQALAALGTIALERVRPPRWCVPSEVGALLVSFGEAGITIELDRAPRWPGLLVMAREAAFSLKGRRVTGEAGFDGAVAIFTDDDAAAAVFDSDLRDDLSAFVHAGGAIEGGCIVLRATRDRATEPPVSMRLMLAVARGLGRESSRGQEDFDELAAELGNDRRTVEERGRALRDLLQRFPAEKIVALEGVQWRAFDYDARVLDAIEGALLREASAIEPVRILLELIWGPSLEKVALTQSFADALTAALVHDPTNAARTMLMRLALNESGAVAGLAVRRFFERHPTFEDLGRALDEGWELREISENPVLVEALLTGAAAAFADPHPPEAAHARLLAARLRRQMMTSKRAPSESLDAFDIRLVAALRDAEDAREPAYLAGLMGRRYGALKRAALAALFVLAEESTLAQLPVLDPWDVWTAAKDAGTAAAGRYLIEHFPSEEKAPLRTAFLETIGEIADASATSLLLAQLDSEDDNSVVLAAITALGKVGDPSALAKLKPLTGGIFRDGVVKDAARAAVGAIMTRGAPLGALSVSDADGGLAIADDDRG